MTNAIPFSPAAAALDTVCWRLDLEACQSSDTSACRGWAVMRLLGGSVRHVLTSVLFLCLLSTGAQIQVRNQGDRRVCEMLTKLTECGLGSFLQLYVFAVWHQKHFMCVPINFFAASVLGSIILNLLTAILFQFMSKLTHFDFNKHAFNFLFLTLFHLLSFPSQKLHRSDPFLTLLTAAWMACVWNK